METEVRSSYFVSMWSGILFSVFLYESDLFMVFRKHSGHIAPMAKQNQQTEKNGLINKYHNIDTWYT